MWPRGVLGSSNRRRRSRLAFAILVHPGVTYDNPTPGYTFLIGWVGVFALGAALGMERSIVARIFGAILIIVAAVPAVTIGYFVVMRR